MRIAHFHVLVESHLILAGNNLPPSTKVEQVVPDMTAYEPFVKMRWPEQIEHLVLRETRSDVAQVMQVDEGTTLQRR